MVGQVKARAPAAIGVGNVIDDPVDPSTGAIPVVAIAGSATADATATGSIGALADTAQIGTQGCGRVVFEFGNGGAGADNDVVFEYQVSGSALFYPVMAYDPTNAQAGSTTLNLPANGPRSRVVNCSGFSIVRARCTRFVNGPNAVLMEASVAAPDPALGPFSFTPSVLVNEWSDVSSVVSLIPAILSSIEATNRNAATRFLQLFNQTAALGGGEVPFAQFAVGPTQTLYLGADMVQYLKPTIGLVYGWSTTVATYTAATAADHDTMILGKAVRA